jgi:hypothetical protein
MTLHSSVTEANGYLIPARIDDNFGYGVATTTKTIDSGVITITDHKHYIAGQGGIADDLTTIYGGKVGQLLTILPSTSAYAITVKKITGGVGNIDMGADVVLQATHTNVHLLCLSTGGAGTIGWVKLSSVST